MAMKTELAPVSARDLQIIEYRGQRVVTNEQLAAGYGTEAENIRRNFSRNKSRFVEGKHYFQISGSELENLRVTFSPAQISNKTRSLTLWTERCTVNQRHYLHHPNHHLPNVTPTTFSALCSTTASFSKPGYTRLNPPSKSSNHRSSEDSTIGSAMAGFF